MRPSGIPWVFVGADLLALVSVAPSAQRRSQVLVNGDEDVSAIVRVVFSQDEAPGRVPSASDLDVLEQVADLVEGVEPGNEVASVSLGYGDLADSAENVVDHALRRVSLRVAVSSPSVLVGLSDEAIGRRMHRQRELLGEDNLLSV